MFNFIRDSFWNDTIKWVAIIIYTSMLFSISGSAALLDPSEVLYLAEINDYKTLCQSFNSDQKISMQDTQQFLLETFAFIQSQYPSDISLYELKSKIIEIIKDCVVDQYSFKKLEPILSATINRLIPNEKVFSMILIKSPLKQPTSEIEVPGCLVFGGTEIVCGALLWLTPFRPLSLVLIADGCRRIGNAVDEKDKELRKHPERQYHPPKYR